jgi:hypothetical protein
MPRTRRIVIGIVLCIGVLSCTRTPQEPTKNSSSRTPPTDPEKVLQNMIDAFHDKNSTNYLYSFSNVSFTFEATANAQRNFPGTFSTWNKSSEQDYFAALMSHVQQNSTVTLKFDSITVNPTAADSTFGDTYYNLAVPLAPTNIEKNFKGRAQFMFARDETGLWSIRQWLDIGLNTSDSTWSDLKGTYAP